MPPVTSRPRIGLFACAAVAASMLGGCAVSATADTRDRGNARSAGPQAAQPAAIEVLSARFGVFGVDESGRRVLLETDSFPAIAAAPYGWYIVFKTPSCSISRRQLERLSSWTRYTGCLTRAGP